MKEKEKFTFRQALLNMVIAVSIVIGLSRLAACQRFSITLSTMMFSGHAAVTCEFASLMVLFYISVKKLNLETIFSFINMSILPEK